MVATTVLVTLALVATLAGFVSGAFFSRPMGLRVFGLAAATSAGALTQVGTSPLALAPLGLLLALAIFGMLASLGGER